MSTNRKQKRETGKKDNKYRCECVSGCGCFDEKKKDAE